MDQKQILHIAFQEASKMRYPSASRKSLVRIAALYSAMLVLVPYHAYCSEKPTIQTQESIETLTELNLEELLNIQVTSVSKAPESIYDAAAAVYVISQDDIRRSGVTSIPEALRLAPGVNVARIDSNKWAISARGFNDRFSNKLLVMIDGRSIYTTMFSGVYWDIQDLVLDDIDRIEVIRGPGAALWGANAVNGVINIITKQTAETHGGLLSVLAGTEDQNITQFRYGDSLGSEADYRMYGKYFDRDHFSTHDGDTADDEWDGGRMGFRIDWSPSFQDEIMFQGNLYQGESKTAERLPVSTAPYLDPFLGDDDYSGGFLLADWKRQLEVTSVNLQTYYHHDRRDNAYADIIRHTFDIDFQHNIPLSDWQEFSWGLGYRLTADSIDDTIRYMSDPATRNDQLFNAFLQDKFELIEDELTLTLGSKFEHNDYSGFEIQPSGRLIWAPNENHRVWGAVSRAVRTPSRFEHDVRFPILSSPPMSERNPLPIPVVAFAQGHEDFEAENLLAYEIGYRYLHSDNLTFDIALFYNQYDDLRSATADVITLSDDGLYAVAPLLADNDMDGETYGAEVSTDYSPLNWWSWSLTYTWIDIQLHLPPDNPIIDVLSDENGTPHHQASIRSSIDIGEDINFDLWLRYTDQLPTYDVPSFITLDARLSWAPDEDLEFSLVGQNLLNESHTEFTRSNFFAALPSEIDRQFYAKVTWKF